jgi:hypothetical protein
MRYILIIVLIACLTIPEVLPNPKSKKQTYPFVVLTNGVLKVTVLLPDAQNAYYRSTRFDWSGIIAQVEYENHTYFQEWQDYNGTITSGNHDPLNPGTGTGTVEEFRNPLGYDEAKIGEPFLKIGVGILERIENKPYHWDDPYKLIEPGEWKIITTRNSIRFIQKIKTDFGFSYEYEKTVVLSENKPEIKITHRLKNTGTKDILGNPYCHNFFQFDYQAVDEYYKITFPKPIQAIDEFDSRVSIHENYFQINTKMLDNSWVGGHINPARTRSYTLSNEKTKTSVEVVSDVDHGPFYICAWKLAFCPEPMIEFDIKTGESFTWSRIYKFRK